MSTVRKAYCALKTVYCKRQEKRSYEAKNAPVHKYLKLNPMPELSESAKKEIDDYWRQFGIKIKDYCWFQWYYGLTGVSDPRFVPNDFYAYIIWPYYDNEQFRFAWKDKNYFERFLPTLTFPNVVLRRINGRFYDAQGNFIPDEDRATIANLLITEGEIIVKDAWDSGEGRGVTKYQVSTGLDAEKFLSEWKSDNFIVQEVIHQHECFAKFNESSVNIMRISSWYHEGKVEILAPTLRVGTAGYATDVCYVNGVETTNVVGISTNGYFKPELITQDGRKTPIKNIVKNPDQRIPHWDDIIQLIRDNHSKLGHFDIIGWDFTVDKNDRIVCIEYNIQRPGIVFYQYVNGPFFGEHTDDVLAYLKDKRNQEKYIPKWLRE